jgi:spermidine/putrescine transport system ATP-binding protein
VTVVVRPEHAEVVSGKSKATITGRLDNIVYFGTDTHYYVTPKGGGEFIVRHQNSRMNRKELERGAEVGVSFEAGAAQVLRD